MDSIDPKDSIDSRNVRLEWYVIQTKPKKEEEARVYLSMKGLEIFCPLMEGFLIRNGKINKEYKPLFPGYMFGKFDLEQDYALVRWGRGVKKVLSLGGGYPTPLSEEVVEVIKRRTDSHGIVRRSYHFEANDRIRIKSGPLKDLLGIFERWVSDGERVRILLNLIGYQPEVELHCSMIEKVA
ncbi:MAG: transcription termination/antitermination protein NusG [Thermodesulfobacteriota bacterium]